MNIHITLRYILNLNLKFLKCVTQRKVNNLRHLKLVKVSHTGCFLEESSSFVGAPVLKPNKWCNNVIISIILRLGDRDVFINYLFLRALIYIYILILLEKSGDYL